MSSDEFDFDASASEASYYQEESSDDESFRAENHHPNKRTKNSAANNKSNASKSKIRSTAAKKAKHRDDSQEGEDEYLLPHHSNSFPAESSHDKKTIEETYQKKTQLEHILLRPDTYIGSTEPLTQPMFILDTTSDDPHGAKIIQKEITYTPGLYKIFDEILVNAADNKQRDPTMDRMEICIDAGGDGGMNGDGDAVISVMNNGRGIPVAMHGEHGCFVPTLIFGHLLTGSNFDDNEKKTTGGRNGYGAKLANIFSTEFIVECLDSDKGKKFKQVWRNNMTPESPIVKKCTDAEKKRGDYTKITFKPDLKRFNMTHLDSDTVGLLSKRAYDIAGCMGYCGGKKLNVYLNGTKIPIKDFKSYLALFEGIEPPAAYEKIGDRWEVGVSMSDGSFQQISFVNAIATTKGGGHVNYIADLVGKSLQAAVKKKNKGGKEIKLNQIKNHLSVFVNCLVENPAFDSQTKENLTTRPATFKNKDNNVHLSDKFFKQVEKCGVVDAIVKLSQFKENQALKRKNGTKKSKLTGITKLDDANFAGTAKSKDCTLIITEGDSAKSLAVSGLSVVGRDYYGVFPLKGKPLNVRDATSAQVRKNEEIMNLVEIMGLKFNTVYTPDNVKTLRYGHLMIMADQDHDGSHIKGLIINFIHHFWPSLLDIPDFLMTFITPIVKCAKGKKTHTFFTLPEYESWKESTGNDAKGWTIKYYKGLGTSTSNEAKEYFSNLDIHEIHFNELAYDIIDNGVAEMEMEDPDTSSDIITSGSGLIDMAFSKSKVEARKKWLNRIEKDTFLNYSHAQKNGIRYSEFINRELILFSIADNVRSIPHVMDGFKPSQRKVLYACFKKKLKSEIKVAQLAGYIGEHSAYHHGDASLQMCIIGMAQTYCGSNNINLLYPSGQFGTRRMGGKDHASARYIFTRLEKIARTIFHPDDDALLNYLNDDGLSVEPEFYVPVIPMVLVNGSDGIGTGYSSTIHPHDPREIIDRIRKMINGDEEEPEIMHPQFAGFAGEIKPEGGKKDGSYIVKGKIERTSDTTLAITELPIRKWTQDYKSFLDGMAKGSDKHQGEISDFQEHHTDTTVFFTVTATKEKIDEFERFKGGLYGKFKLQTTISTKNMTAFDVDGKLHRYATTTDVLRVFFDQRLEYYVKRKALLLEKMREELKILENKARFVEEVCKGDLVVSSRKRTELLAELQEKEYDLFRKDTRAGLVDEDDDQAEEIEESATDSELAKGYDYLLGMKIWSLTFERAGELRKQLAEKMGEVSLLETTKPETIWLNDLTAIEQVLDERDAELDAETKKEKQAQSKARVRAAKTANKKAKKSKKRKDVWDSDLEDSDEDDESFSDEDNRQLHGTKQVVAPKRKTPPKKEMISLGDSSFKPNQVSDKISNGKLVVSRQKTSPEAEQKKVSTKKMLKQSTNAKLAHSKRKTAHESSDESDENMDDIFDAEMDDDSTSSFDNNSVPLASAARSSRSRRSRNNVSYKIDDSESDESDQDSQNEIAVEDDVSEAIGPQMALPGNGTGDFSRESRKDQFDMNFGVSGDEEELVPKKKATQNKSAAQSIKRHRFSGKASYKNDEPSDVELEEESDDETNDLEIDVKMNTSSKSFQTSVKDEFDMDFEDSDDESLFTKKPVATKKKVSLKPGVAKKKSSLKPDPNRVLQSLAVDNDNLVDTQSFGSPSPMKKKSYKAAKKHSPKKKASSLTKAKVSPKKKAPVKKQNKKPNKSVCNLSSDESDRDDFLSDGFVASDVDSVASDGTGDVVMNDVETKSSGRRARGKVPSYADAQSSDDEFDEEESEVEFD